MTLDYIANNKVIMFSKSYCPFCSKSKMLFSIKNIECEVIELDKLPYGSEMQAELENISGQRTVPNIFINGKHVGGSSEL
jgi:glutaredoxin 3